MLSKFFTPDLYEVVYAGTDEHDIEAEFIVQPLECDVGTDSGVADGVGADGAERKQQFFGQLFYFEVGDAVAEDAAEFGPHVVDGALVAAELQFFGNGETGGPLPKMAVSSKCWTGSCGSCFDTGLRGIASRS
jgi:hypothetical protein